MYRVPDTSFVLFQVTHAGLFASFSLLVISEARRFCLLGILLVLFLTSSDFTK